MCASHDIVGEIKSMLKSGLKLLTGKKKINERNNRPSALTSGRQQLVMVMVDL